MSLLDAERAKAIRTLGLAISLCGLLAGNIAVADAAQPDPGGDPVVLRADGHSLLLDWRAPSYVLQREEAGDGSVEIPEASGWSTTDRVAEAPLPFATALVALPPSGGVRLSLQSSSQTRKPLPFPLRLTSEEAGDRPAAVLETLRAPATAMAAGPWDTVVLSELGIMRGHRLARLSFFPFHYDQRSQSLDVMEEVRVEIVFEEGIPSSSDSFPSTDRSQESPMEAAVRGRVINPSQFSAFSGASDGEVVLEQQTASLQSGESSERFKIAVDQEGVYELTYSALSSAGVPLPTTPPAGLRLSHAGEEVAYEWEDADGDGTFTGGDRLLFYARPTSSRWVDHDIYWLTAGVPGTLMTERSGNPSGVGQEGTLWATTIAESNIGPHNYRSWYPSPRDGDHWYWSKLWRNYADELGDYDQTFEVQLLAPASTGADAALTVYIQGDAGSRELFPDHQVVAHLNGHGPLSPPLAWNGDSYYSETVSVRLDALQPGVNQVRLRIPDGRSGAGVDRQWLDAIELAYPVIGLGGAAARVEGETGEKWYSLSKGYGGTRIYLPLVNRTDNVASSLSTGYGGTRIYDVRQVHAPRPLSEASTTADSVTFADTRIYDVTQVHAPRPLSEASTTADSVTFADGDAAQASYFIFADSHVASPEWITPAKAVEESLEGAEYLIISHSDFLDAVRPLADRREANDGLDVRTVSVEAVYDTFGDGRMDPLAIRRCISETYHSSSPPTLDYVLLVGDGTYDPLNNLASPFHRPTFIPPYLAFGDPWVGEVTADNRYVTVDGDDSVPDVSLGRLPVNSAAETRTVVDKILAYEKDPPPWPWNETLLFVADATETDNRFHDEANDLYNHASALEGFVSERRYYCKESCDEAYLIEGNEEMRRATFSALNRGPLLATWVGHSFWHQWGTDRLFHLDDVASLHNGGALPVYLQMTCLTSFFSLPDTDALDEALLRLEGGGAVATWGSTSTGLTTSHVAMHQGFVDTALGDGAQPLGPSVDAGELEAPAYYWDSFVLLGDPALALNREVVYWAARLSLPLVMRGAD